MAFLAPVIHPLIIILSVVAVFFAVVNFSVVKKVLVGRPVRTRELRGPHTKLFWLIALPILAADLYSSVAYGPEAGITELVGLGPDARWLILPLTLATVVLLTILILSYIMGVLAYPDGGGAYAIAKDNFRHPLVSLTAASALMIDYVLTVAVSIASGIQTLASAYPALVRYEVVLSVLCILIILLVNLRGISESAKVFAWPTFAFMACMVLMIVVGVVSETRHGAISPQAAPFGVIPKELTTLLLLKAFSSACSALTGIETISNSVPVFRQPAQRGAIKAYVALGTITGFTLLGFAWLVYSRGLSVNPNNTLLSQLAALYFHHNIMYQIIIWATLVVLILAANSTFTGFPQIAALLARDGFLPRALLVRGDRLGYSNGMLVLAALAALLIEAFRAQTDALIPLYAIGVFVAFTIAQAGLVRRWWRVHGPYWRGKLTLNAVGSGISAIVACVFAVTKFTGGAWIVLIVLPLLILAATTTRRHYINVANELRIDPLSERPLPHHVLTVVMVSGVHRAVLNTLSFADSIGTDLVAFYIGFDDESVDKMEQRWQEWGNPCRLIAVKSEYRSIIRPLNRLLVMLESAEGGRPDHIHVVIPQFVPRAGWQQLLHNQTSLLIRTWVLLHKDVVITTVPYHLHR